MCHCETCTACTWQSQNSYDPVEFYQGTWGFWDESWSNFHGGFDSEEAARSGLRDYAAVLPAFRFWSKEDK